jgi:hypothetical protein
VKDCSTCGSEARRLICRECKTCYTYRKRHGHARPIGLIVAHARRVFEREEERKWLRRWLESA